MFLEPFFDRVFELELLFDRVQSKCWKVDRQKDKQIWE